MAGRVLYGRRCPRWPPSLRQFGQQDSFKKLEIEYHILYHFIIIKYEDSKQVQNYWPSQSSALALIGICSNILIQRRERISCFYNIWKYWSPAPTTSRSIAFFSDSSLKWQSNSRIRPKKQKPMMFFIHLALTHIKSKRMRRYLIPVRSFPHQRNKTLITKVLTYLGHADIDSNLIF